MKVQVLMSTYNGEKYLEEQIESILNQDIVTVSLLVRDDGSSDSTKSILKKYSEKYSNIKVVYEDNIGVKKSFLRLVQLSDNGYDYYAFSDQDDIWKDDKLTSAVNILNSYDSKKPLLYGSSVQLMYNEGLGGIQFKNSGTEFGNFLVKNYFPGCTTVFNNSLKKLICKTDYDLLSNKPLHDHWINLICSGCGGKIIFDTTPHIYYRQHDSNVVGDVSIIKKIKNNSLWHKENTRFNIARELWKYYENDLTNECIKEISLVINYQKSFLKRIQLAFNPKIKPLSVIEKVVVTMTVLTGGF